MVDQELREAFNDCIDRMAAGQSIGDCLRRYPQHAAALRPMLEVGSMISRAQADSIDVAMAQARVRERVRARAASRPRQRSYGRLVMLAASLVIAFVAVFAAAENSLPGDSLYGVKRFGENARGALVGDDFGARREEEIRVLLALNREADVEFTGAVEAMGSTLWHVAGLDVVVGAGTEQKDQVRIGDTVRVKAHTTAQGELVALAFTVVQSAEPTPVVAETVEATPTSQPSETVILSQTSTQTPTQEPTATYTPSPTATFAPTTTLTVALSQTPLPSISTSTPPPTVCSPVMPSGWVRYVIQSSDTVVGLAAVTGASVERLVDVNCLPQNLMIIAGQALFLPALPPEAPTLQPTVGEPVNAQPTDDDHGGDDHGGDNSGSNSGSDDSGGDDHSGSGGGGGDD